MSNSKVTRFKSYSGNRRTDRWTETIALPPVLTRSNKGQNVSYAYGGTNNDLKQFTHFKTKATKNKTKLTVYKTGELFKKDYSIAVIALLIVNSAD